MSNQLQVIEKAIQSERAGKELMLALELQPGDEQAINTAKAYTSSVLMEVQRSAGSGGYTDLTTASPDSIVRAMIDAAKHKLQIDGRKLCYLEKRGNNVGLQITTNGFVAKIKERYPDASFVITPVFNGDSDPQIKHHTDGCKTCEFVSTNVFGGVADLKGILVQIGYTDHGGKQVSDVQTMSIPELKIIKSKGKGTAWNDFPLERMKTAALKRATKWHFRKDSTLQKLIDYDNKENFDVAAPATPVRRTIIDNINAGSSTPPPTPQPESEEVIEDVAAVVEQPEIDDSVIDGEYTEVIEPQVDPALEQSLIAAGDAAASQGRPSYVAWIQTLPDSEKDIVRSRHADWQAKSKEVTLAQAAPPVDNDAPPI